MSEEGASTSSQGSRPFSPSDQEEPAGMPQYKAPEFNLPECKLAMSAFRHELLCTERLIQQKACDQGTVLTAMLAIRAQCDNKFTNYLKDLEGQSRHFDDSYNVPKKYNQGTATGATKWDPTKYLLTEAQISKIKKEKYAVKERFMKECNNYIEHLAKIESRLHDFRINFDKILAVYPPYQRQEIVTVHLATINTALSLFYEDT